MRPRWGFKNQPRQSAGAGRPEIAATAAYAMRLPVVITIGANEMRARLPLMISPAMAKSSVSAVDECTSTCSISASLHAASISGVKRSGATPRVGKPRRSSGLGSPGATTISDGSVEEYASMTVVPASRAAR